MCCNKQSVCSNVHFCYSIAKISTFLHIEVCVIPLTLCVYWPSIAESMATLVSATILETEGNKVITATVSEKGCSFML